MYSDTIVDTAVNGLEALAHIDTNRYDLVVADIDMPEMDGYDMLTEIRSRNLTMPVICVTAYAIKGDKDRLLAHGFDDYLPKPMRMDDFEAIVEKHLFKTAD
jgi:CheY-like chemotaxis protein